MSAPTSFPPKAPKRAVDSDSRQLAGVLLEMAGLGKPAEIRPLGRHSNAHYLIRGGDGGRYVLRRFKENPPPHSARVRCERECWIYEQLAVTGAPVPRLLAASTEPGAQAMLTAYVEGDHLGTIVPRLPNDRAASAWSSCGRTLAAVHAIDGRRAAAAGCERVGIEHPAASRGPWHYEEALSYLEQLAIARPDVGSLSELAAAVNDALPLYRRAPLVLCQYDAHLWQFLVAHDSQGQWRCTAILDWEHADLDDPDWDLAQLDGFRFAPVGAVPGDFFAGYGRTPASPLYTLYRLERAAWILSRHASGGHDWLALSVPLAEQLIRGLLARPDELREQIR
ncbi:MAG: hypothetical protein E6G25_06255 [Actinobacteria bacterium]|nr:MAG: hypothetical protein E6G25_06255 [Actinomycetota bacterium]